MNKLLLALASVALLSAPARAAVETYTIDPVHSSAGFTIRHFVSNVPGRFTKVEGTISVDRADLEKSSVEATIEVASVDTANTKRDSDLKSPNFFDAAKFPAITFKSTSWKKTGDATFDVTGDLTIKETTKPVTLKVTLLGFGPGMGGAQLSGWEATTALKKSDFGVDGPAMLKAILGDDVSIKLSIEADMKR